MNKAHLAPQVEWKEICPGSILLVDGSERLQWWKTPFLGPQKEADELQQKID